MNYIWKFREKADESTIQDLANSLKIPKSLIRVLTARGIRTEEEVKNFFDPGLENIHNPFLMDGMEEAVDRILRAVNKKELIWIHGDYDVDGTASTAMMYQFLTDIGGDVDYYIPDRLTDGFGLSLTSIKQAQERNAKLVISVDVGITSFEPISYANENGIDVIVCDHHEPCDQLPEAYVILDPLKPNCKYPFKNLAASGVVFKFIQAIAIKLGIEEKAFEFLDYVVIASAADMVPLIGENRILALRGLTMLNEKPRAGIKGLMYCTGLKQGQITTSSIVYSLAPLINAAGRLGDAKRSVRMMTQKDEFSAFRIAQKLERENIRRRAFDEKTFEEAIPMAQDMIKNSDVRSLVLYSPDWHSGVIGIVASRLVDKFHLPTVLLTSFENLAKGSARSINSFDIHNALKSCSHLLTEFGGHKHAAGLSLEERNIPEFKELFDKVAQEKITKEMTVPEILIDSELKFNELSPQFLNVLNQFAPFGFENNKPVFYTKGVTSANGMKIVGNNHLKFRAYQSHFVIDAIAYNLADKIGLCSNGKPFSIVYSLEESTFNGQNTIQLRIKDIRASE